MFSAEQDDSIYDDDATQLNYEVDTENNLFGFQIGGGISYCVTDRLQAYGIGRFGVYGNHIEQTHRLYGTAGTVTWNTGDFSGQDFLIQGEDDDLSFVGQLDLGARWCVNDCWTVDFGYRLVGLTGVAISEDNVAMGNFQNALGIADTQTSGSVLLHGGYLGATYCW
jgi:opacity protein-like surface antigen